MQFFFCHISSSNHFSVYLIQIRRSMAKLELYRKFTNALAVSVLLSVAWIGYEVLSLSLFLGVVLLLEKLAKNSWYVIQLSFLIQDIKYNPFFNCECSHFVQWQRQQKVQILPFIYHDSNFLLPILNLLNLWWFSYTSMQVIHIVKCGEGPGSFLLSGLCLLTYCWW